MADTNTKAKAPAKSTRARKATAVQTASVEAALAQSPLEMVAFSDLVDTEYNARIIPHTPEEIASLAATIKAVGILQNLIVINLPGGRRGVVGGRGRMTATAKLVEEGFIAADQLFVPVKAIPVELAKDASYIENMKRKAMHPAEQLISFRMRSEEGQTAAQIADLLGYTVRHVERCLKLANLAPELIQELANDAITLEQCQVLTLEPDQARQVQIWTAAKQYYGNGVPQLTWLRNQIVSGEMTMASPAFRFVGPEAYEAEGGALRRDLFSVETEGWADTLLVNRLVQSKLDAEALRLQQEEGWGWSLARIEPVKNYHPDNKSWYFAMPEPEYTAAERQRIEALDAALEESDNYDDENQFQQELEDLEAAAVNRQLTPEFKAGLGIVVSMSRDGSDFYIQRAIGKVEDLPKTRSQDADVTNENGVITLRQPDIKADAFSANLVETLSAERSLVTQAVLATSPKVAMALLTWTFCREVFEGDWCTGVQAPLCINLHQQTWTLQSNAPSGREGAAWLAIQGQQAALQAMLPANWKQDFTWLLEWSEQAVQALLAFCVASAVNGVQKRANGKTDRSPLDVLETALDIDLYDWWQPTAENYFSKISKDQIADAVQEAGFAERSRDVLKLKKGDAATLAQDILTDTRWVPDWMTRPQPLTAADDASTDTTATPSATDHAA
ncbi:MULTISPECIES: ParB/RepB/Spo0J family partition protein [Phytobacter]|uniref:Nuclease n=1 Tax=Phytobacter diazotrophicus TaxID=395631 RepID=A0ABN6M2D9_9ENTR|nr:MULTISPECIES: ParB N-terminal domain-containing protein [Phytobacter]MCL5500315.1 ParB N-terminal domain-containing protein [Escherichia coli]MDV2875120.1 ParB N-terminal domain-containing protein [Phytobacter diazotrophicus]BBE80748.1 nuclease [Phytobacter sp. MRY16-398]BDD54018.1 nuclease [Phytobacter diazotrophicus]BEG84951.1 ParB N-terminal domain-containing protein [Phytobacter diazotrophicus]